MRKQIITNLIDTKSAYGMNHMFSLPCFDTVESGRYALDIEWTPSKQINRKSGRFRHLLT